MAVHAKVCGRVGPPHAGRQLALRLATALPAAVTDVIPVWAIIAIVVGVLLLVVAAVLLWRAKRKAEYRYSRLLSTQPIELADDDGGAGLDNIVGLPTDEQEQGGDK